MSIYVATSLVALLLYGGLFVFVLLHGLKGNRPSLTFSAYIFAMALVQVGYLMVSFATSAEQALWWYSFLILVGVGPPMLFLIFTRTLLSLKSSKKLVPAALLAWLPLVILVITLRRSVIFTDIYRDGKTGLFVPEFGSIVPLLFIPMVLLWFLTAFSLVKRYRSTKFPLERIRIQYLLLGIVLVWVGTMTNLAPALRPYPVDVVANILSALLITYAILRYHLLDINVFIRKSLLYAISTVVNGAGYFLIIYFAIHFFGILAGPQIIFLALAVAIVSSVVAQPLRDVAQRWIDKVFFRESYDISLMVQKLIRAAASTLDLQKLMNMILDDVTGTMHIQRAVFFRKADGSGDLRLAAHRGLDQGIEMTLGHAHPFLERLSRHGKALTLDDLGGVLRGQAPGGWEMAGLERLRMELFVPLLTMGKLVGVLAVGPKLSQRAYAPDEVLALATLADQTAVAVENARLYETVQRQLAERTSAEWERAKLQEQLAQSQKMESVGRLAGGVAHDFNNMLGVILGHTELALEQVDPPNPLHADLTEIRKAANRSADLTRQLLAFARKQAIAPKVVDLNKTVADMLNMLQRLIGEDVHLTWRPKTDLWPVKVDPSQIDQILANLCVNARDAISDVGRITIETGNSTIDEALSADHPGFVPGEYVLLAVSDDGNGMDNETLSHIFEPFFTTKGMGKGTGLGLATVYGAVKQNNGFINAHSEPSQGTTFTIYLPRHAGKAEQVLGQSAAGPDLRGQETILLVEDEPSVLKLTPMMLEKQGYTVLAAGTPGEAIRLASERAAEIHLLMADVVMPEMNGRDLARNLSIHIPRLRCLFASGYTADIIAHHGVLDDGVYFIQKPFAMKDLAAKVRETLDSE